MSEEKTKVRYFLPLIDRIGQLGWEMFSLRNLYPSSEYDVTVVAPLLENRPRTNIRMFDIAMRGISVEHTADEELLHSAHPNLKKPIEIIDNTIHNLNTINVPIMFLKDYAKTRQLNFRFSLSEKELEEGELIRRQLGIPSEAPIVTLHAREGGYLPNRDYHSFRDINVGNYIPAIQYLLDKGYYVVRLGDSSMTRFDGTPENFIDAPFHPNYNQLFEAYFLAQSKFYIGTTSGPIAIAFGFGTPSIQLNAPIHWTLFGFANDLLVPKHFYSRKLSRELTLEEIVHSPLLSYSRTEDFEQAGIDVRENSAEEILLSIQEFEARLDGSYLESEDATKTKAQVRSILQRAQISRRELTPKEPLYLHWLRCSFSSEFIKLNPYFVGHPW